MLFAPMACYEPGLSKKKAEVNYQNETIVSNGESIHSTIRPGSTNLTILNGNRIRLAAITGP